MPTNDQRAVQIKAMLKQQLLRYKTELKGHRVFLFGSRATGKARPRSDFDVGAYGDEPLPLKTFFAIEDTFDDLPTLYKIDWVDLNRVNPEFRERAMEHIEVLYE
ncbi:MAG: nucleotidyltransferase domain-containing protein [Burkholderiales bacterium]|nr:nucleotidyltransferase domain-containing protein [Burkholderiales bacterium]